jgi:hypothetical protein
MPFKDLVIINLLITKKKRIAYLKIYHIFALQLNLNLYIMKKQLHLFFALAFLFCVYNSLPAQVLTQNDYYPIQVSGDVPLDFRKTIEDKLNEHNQKVNKGVSTKPMSKEEKIEEEFLISQQYHINQMMHSGQIFFGDSVTEYLNDVAKKLLENTFPELLNEIRIYASFSPAVNAYATDEGVIIVNVGLIAQLTNEAELAFFIAHEIAHYVKKHSITSFKEDKAEKSKFGFVQDDDYLLRKNSRSRDIEREADQYAFKEIYLPAGYSPKALQIAFDILKYSYLPIDEIEFPTDYFDNEYFTVKSGYFLDSDRINPIAINEDYDEDKSTHPACDERKMKLLSFVSDEEFIAGKSFMLSEERFNRIRDIARFEMINSQLLACDYVNVFYNAFIMQKYYPNNIFIHKAILYAEYAVMKYKTDRNTSAVVTYYRKMEGASQQLSYFFNKVSKEELGIIALRKAYELKKAQPENDFIDDIFNDIVRELVYEYDIKYQMFSREKRIELANDTAAIENDNKYSRISANQESNFDYKYAFVDIVQDKEFMEAFEHWEDKYLAHKEKMDKEKQDKKSKKQSKEQDIPDDINSIMLFDPFFVSVDLRNYKNSVIEYEKTEKIKDKFTQDIISIAERNNINTSLVSTEQINEDETELYNIHKSIYAWIYELSSHEIDEDDYIISFQSQYLQKVIDYSDTKYMLWPLAVEVKSRDEMDAYMNCCYAALILPLSPYFLYKAFTASKKSELILVLLDIEKGYTVDYTKHSMNSKYRDDKIKSKIHSTMFKYKNK